MALALWALLHSSSDAAYVQYGEAHQQHVGRDSRPVRRESRNSRAGHVLGMIGVPRPGLCRL